MQMKPWRDNWPVGGPLWSVLICALLLLPGCPRQPADAPAANKTTARQTEAQPEPVAVHYPAVARDYLFACLQHPTESGYPPLGPAWQLLGQLRHCSSDPELAALNRRVTGMVEAAGGEPVPELATAWLAVEPEQATEFIAAKLAADAEGYLDALAYRPEIALAIFADTDPLALSAAGQLYLVRMLVAWRPLSADYLPLLTKLAQAEAPKARLQAIGMLIPLGSASDEQWQELWHAGHDGGADMEAAVEGIRLSGDGGFADALVPHAAKARLGEAQESKPQHEVLYAAYALTFLPGEQAQLMRRKLLAAADPTVRWAARLGELLHGTPRPWEEAVAAEGATVPALLVALQPKQVVHPDLLPTYTLLAGQPDASLRIMVASHLNRYTPYTSYPAAAELATGLAADTAPEVRAAAWLAIAELGLPDLGAEAAAIVADETQSGEVRLAAAAYLMMQADKIYDQEVAP
ncbi:hypothetical protein JW859_10695 [bacterium]|nr:hypothetical protein [bacterium]